MAEPPATDPAARPFVVPCADLDTGAPWRWLRAGWRDLRRAPALSLLFGAVIVLVSAGISWLAYALGRFALLATLLSGFVFVAPLICVGLYCVSRALEQGRTPRLRDSFVLARRVLGQGAVVLLITDGLDREGASGLDEEMERLHKSCSRMIWLNPLLRYGGYEPKSQGNKAMLPHVDEFRPVHNLESLSGLIAALGARTVGADKRLAGWQTDLRKE